MIDTAIAGCGRSLKRNTVTDVPKFLAALNADCKRQRPMTVKQIRRNDRLNRVIQITGLSIFVLWALFTVCVLIFWAFRGHP